MRDAVFAIVLWLFVAFVGNLAALWAFKTMDSAWECRAKSAGYYNTLPDNLKNPQDVK